MDVYDLPEMEVGLHTFSTISYQQRQCLLLRDQSASRLSRVLAVRLKSQTTRLLSSQTQKSNNSSVLQSVLKVKQLVCFPSQTQESNNSSVLPVRLKSQTTGLFSQPDLKVKQLAWELVYVLSPTTKLRLTQTHKMHPKSIKCL